MCLINKQFKLSGSSGQIATEHKRHTKWTWNHPSGLNPKTNVIKSKYRVFFMWKTTVITNLINPYLVLIQATNQIGEYVVYKEVILY